MFFSEIINQVLFSNICILPFHTKHSGTVVEVKLIDMNDVELISHFRVKSRNKCALHKRCIISGA